LRPSPLRVHSGSRNGRAVVIAAKPKFGRLADSTLENSRGVFNSTPAVAGDRILLRSNKFLYALGEK
ncbi:MAG: serine/threonine protein kinase, partial [Opitutaceae bacterium]|nr:serine/threonine protein kinase [Verrucomicrobiales bacterium]